MSKNAKVKNPCKYCCEPVNNKTGLQCEGACKKWAHFKCLNYTPGKISDIKAGLIKVMCPCPDCETTQVKEYMTNGPFICSNTNCPANQQKGEGEKKGDEAFKPSNKQKAQKPQKCSNKTCPNEPVECPATVKPASPVPAGKGAVPAGNGPILAGKGEVPADKGAVPASKGVTPCLPIPASPAPCEQKKEQKEPAAAASSVSTVSSCHDPNCPSKSPSGEGNDKKDTKKNQASMEIALKEMCGTVGKLSVQIKDLMNIINEP